LGFTDSKVLIKIERDLKVLFPEKLWNKINKTLVGFGQTTCKPINPNSQIVREKKFAHLQIESDIIAFNPIYHQLFFFKKK
jgi:endonuclease III